MAWIDLGNPFPRTEHTVWQAFDWHANAIEPLEMPLRPTEIGFEETVLSRRSNRLFGLLGRNQLAHFLWLSCRITGIGADDLGFTITQRPTPSAGAIHPVHVVVNDGVRPDWFRYAPESHSLDRLDWAKDKLDQLSLSIREVLDPQSGAVILFVAEPGKTNSKYCNAASLVWRDAGVLIGHMALVAEALRLNYCPLGITGEPWISRLDTQGKLSGVGAALLGARPST